jgi:pimeloyl-ACP methyl ester carboxylesterase
MNKCLHQVIQAKKLNSMKLTIVPFLLFMSFATTNGQVQDKEFYEIGFDTLALIDSSRIYKTNASDHNSLHFRPVEVDIWYPSADKGSDKLHFRDFLNAFEVRANKLSGKTSYTGIAEELALLFAAEGGLKPEDGKKLLNIETNSYKNLSPITEKKPLILYMAGLNGMAFENYKLIESLTKEGYVVMSISSIGRYPGDMTNNTLDLMEQVYDAESAIKALKKQSKINIDFNQIAVIGCSWGGMSAAVLTSRNPNIKALISLDGSETTHYGKIDEENKNPEEFYDSDISNQDLRTISYLYLGSENSLMDSVPGDEFNYYRRVHGNKYFLRLAESRHEDFSCIPYILNASKKSVDTYNTLIKSSMLFLNATLKNENAFVQHYSELQKFQSARSVSIQLNESGANTVLLKGIVLDEETKNQIPFVNIAILNKDIGTVTNDTGQFTLKANTNINDTVRISMIGYKAKLITIGELQANNHIKLQKDIKQLKEVVVTAKKLKTKVVGNKTTSRFLSTGFFPGQLGAEMGIKINIGKKPAAVDAFNFHISYNRLKSQSTFRLNIYTVVNGKPSQNILTENITIAIEGKQSGLMSIDLKPYHIILYDDVIVTLEWIKNEKEPKDNEAIFFSLGLLTNGTFVKTSSQAEMKKHSNLGVGFNLHVRY